MSKLLAVSIVAAIAVGMFSPVLHAQDEKWNTLAPPLSTYKNKKPAGPPPRRDISGIWDSGWVGGSGNPEHPSSRPGGGGTEGGQVDETGIAKPIPYTARGLEALKLTKPSGPGLRQVDSALSNDPANLCDPLGFPYMFTWEMRTINVMQSPTQVVMINPFYGGYRIIWTDGRTLPKDPDLRWNGYAVGRWTDDATFAVQTNGLNPRSWLDHQGRPHSEQIVIDETYHFVDRDTIELTMKITDPVMYTEPWFTFNKYLLHRQPPDFDIRENLCSPSEYNGYNTQYGIPAIREESKPK
jgi:hypothetical protein